LRCIAPNRETATAGQVDRPRPSGDEMKILVIDDDAAFRYALARILGKSGFEVSIADDGETGIALCHNQAPDLVICDLMMPYRDGLETIAQIRRESPAIKIIAISGGGEWLNADGLATALEKGADQIIVKPFDSQALLASVRTVLGDGEDAGLSATEPL
jgi:DNA-binding response OmpR family regulator